MEGIYGRSAQVGVERDEVAVDFRPVQRVDDETQAGFGFWVNGVVDVEVVVEPCHQWSVIEFSGKGDGEEATGIPGKGAKGKFYSFPIDREAIEHQRIGLLHDIDLLRVPILQRDQVMAHGKVETIRFDEQFKAVTEARLNQAMRARCHVWSYCLHESLKVVG